MSRIATYASNRQLISTMLQTQSRVQQTQMQIASEKVSDDYAGIAADTERLLSLENARGLLERFAGTGALIKERLDMAATSLAGIDETLRDFRQMLLDNGGSRPLDPRQVEDMQQAAFAALKELEGYLNTRVDGRFLFAGSRVTTRPVDVGADSLEQFQARYDGRATQFPETRAALLADFSLDPGGDWMTVEETATGPSLIRSAVPLFAGLAPGTSVTISGTPAGANDGNFTVKRVIDAQTIELATVRFITEPAAALDPPVAATVTAADGGTLAPAATGGLRFDGATGEMTAAAAGSLAPLAVGSVFHVAGSGSNDGSYEVLANDGTTVTVSTRTLADTGGVAVGGRIAASRYYRGDAVALDQRVDANRAFSFDINGLHPAFDKAIRAMGLIAQGTADGAGGLALQPERIEHAIRLLNGAIDATAAGPTGADEAGDTLADLQSEIGYEQVLIEETSVRHKELAARFEGRIAGIENVDRLEAVARFLDDSRALEVSYQAVARVRQLSLVQFL
jgi:flagellin-like hook-associated protein FlgL